MLEGLKGEIGFQHISYGHNLDLILEYYRLFFRHYRLCQRVASADGHRRPDGSITNTKDDFDSALGQFLKDWAEQEGAIRLLLPEKALELHGDAIYAFNKFKCVALQDVHAEETREDRVSIFAEIDAIKKQMEAELRKFLRSENMLR